MTPRRGDAGGGFADDDTWTRLRDDDPDGVGQVARLIRSDLTRSSRPSATRTSAGAGKSGSGGGGAMFPGEARRQAEVARDYADWLADTRRLDMWMLLQERRALLFGRAVLENILGFPKSVMWVRAQVEEGGKKAGDRPMVGQGAEVRLHRSAARRRGVGRPGIGRRRGG